MRHGVAVQRQAVAVEAPGAAWVFMKSFRRGDVHEGGACGGEPRIGLPEASLAAEVRQAGIDAHSRAGGHDQRVGAGDQGGGPLDGRAVGKRLVAGRRLHAPAPGRAQGAGRAAATTGALRPIAACITGSFHEGRPVASGACAL